MNAIHLWPIDHILIDQTEVVITWTGGPDSNQDCVDRAKFPELGRTYKIQNFQTISENHGDD